MPGSHSSVVGGSNAARVLNCPGSASLLAKIPPAAEAVKPYATEGTALHTLIADLITGRLRMADIKPGETTVAVPGEGSVVLTRELFQQCLLPALAHYQDLCEEDQIDTVPLVEREGLIFPGIEGAHGTCDLILHSRGRNRTRIHDWKFGSGVSAPAVTPDPEDPAYEFIAPQLLFYATAAWFTYPELFPPGVEIVLSIFQPRAPEAELRATEAIIGREDLEAFAADLAAAVRRAREPDAPRRRGSWCRFAECKVICPEHQGPTFAAGRELILPRTDPAYLESLVRILSLRETAEKVFAEAARQAQALLEDGHDVPGWKLVQKRATRQWTVEPQELARALRKLFKLRKADLYEQSLKSPAGIEKLLPKGMKIPDTLALAKSSGTTLAPESDERPAVNRRRTFGTGTQAGFSALARLLGRS